MNTRPFLLLFLVQICLSDTVTFNLRPDGTNAWEFEGLGLNPDITAKVGDEITFDVTGIDDADVSHTFAIQKEDGTRYPTDPEFLESDGSLTLLIGEDAAGMTLVYIDERYPDMMGNLMVLADTEPLACDEGFWMDQSDQNICKACTLCLATETEFTPCTETADRVCLNATAPEEPEEPLPGACSLPNCKQAVCWSDNEPPQCQLCERGFFIDSDLTCTRCNNCSANEYVSWPCEGYTDNVCSPCYGEGSCGPCQVGWTQDLYGICSPVQCMIRGCGAANLDVVCAELNATHFLCICPVEEVHTLTAGVLFAGCDDDGSGEPRPPPTDEEVVAHINSSNLVAFLVNGMLNVTGVIMGDTLGNTFSLTINATIPIDTMADLLKQQIALFLGGDYTAEDITIEFTGTNISLKRNLANVQVTVGANASNARTLGAQIYLLALGLLFIALIF